MPPNELSNPFPVENAGNPAYSRRPPTTVLLVGPDPGDRPLLASVFALPEWKPYWTCNYREAMQALICDRMTVIICDRYLPDGCWKDVLSQTQILSDPPCVVVACALPDSAFWAEVFNLGGYDVLEKPFVREEVEVVAQLASGKFRNDVEAPRRGLIPLNGPGQAVAETPTGSSAGLARAAHAIAATRARN